MKKKLKKKIQTFNLDLNIMYNSNDMEQVDAIRDYVSKIKEDMETLHSKYGMGSELGEILIFFPEDYRPDTQ